ncbi:MAG TPA: TonB-dependent receptor, partial [Acidobacteriaceae bacterium]|nr:TonB-dependent receptor [Acidobacteriaceae bacterium]
MNRLTSIGKLLSLLLLFGMAAIVLGQETTGSLQGTVKDPSGALVANARVSVTTPSLAGGMTTETDSKGYYHLSNLPPGLYVVSVDAKGFQTLKRSDLRIEVGHLPTLDLSLSMGSEATVVEVTSATPQIDVTTTTTNTNITEDVVSNIPHGTSFQSAIQFAPSARNEPLQGMSQFSIGNGNGATSPGSGSNGNAFGYSIAGGADSENSYLVEGQETSDLIGGYSHTNVPFDFIQEMVMDTSGIQAEHGGALGGVINVIMDKGTNQIHGAAWMMASAGMFNGSPRAQPRYDPNGVFSPTTDVTWQQYQPKRYHTSDMFPGVRVGLPIFKDKLFLFAAFSPEWSDEEHTVTYNPTFAASNFPGATGSLNFAQNTHTYYANVRLDGAIGSKIHVFASVLDQGQRQTGETLPNGDDVHGLYNTSASINPLAFEHSLGYSAPNSTYNFGLDYTASNSLVLTSRYGYFFANYHDFGYPTTGVIFDWYGSGVGGTDVNGAPLPADLQKVNGNFNIPSDQTYTLYHADKRIQFDQDAAWFKSGWGGTHNFKFGYQLTRLNNNIYQRWNAPFVEVFPGGAEDYFAAGSTGAANCAAIVAANGPQYENAAYTAAGYPNCTGKYGYVIVQDYGTQGQATSYDNAIFGQDSWTIGKGLTINYGLRVESEFVPSENNAAGIPSKPINFGWGDKIAPRVGFAWDPMHNGKSKIFGSYGSFTDMMKLNVAIGSFGGQYWQNCAYALSTDPLTNVNVAFDSNFRYCNATTANFGGGTTPAGLTFIESLNNRGTEGVTPGLKPYRQHESVFGYDYQIAHGLAFEARWDRRRLDDVIEDAALFDSGGNEIFTIVNPGFGGNAINATCATGTSSYAACPPDPPAARSYDGLEFRLNKAMSNHWSGLLSYTYSSFRGNYNGLTSSDEADGGGGRNAPNNSRAFDETYFSFNAYGQSDGGKLPLDRPNAFKGYAYYTMDEGHKTNTTLGLFQDIYSGTPQQSFVDVGYSIAGGGNFGQFAVYPEGRGKWVDVSQNAKTGVVTVGNAYVKRTPMFTQSDINLKQTIKIKGTQELSFDATFTNALNEHKVVAYYASIDTAYEPDYLTPGGVPFYYGGVAYSAYEHPYAWKTLMNTDGVTVNSQ